MKTPQQMKEELVRRIIDTRQDVKQHFQANPNYQRTGMVNLSEFKQIAEQRMTLSSLDAEFLASFYTMNQDVDCNRFFAEVQSGGQTQMAPDQQKLQILLKNLGEAAVTNRKDDGLHQRLSSHSRGGSAGIDRNSFLQEIRGFYNLYPQDEDVLCQTYQSPANRNEIDYVRFMQEIRVHVQGAQNVAAVVLTESQKREYMTLKQTITQNRLENEMAKQFTQQDSANSGYMAQNFVKQCLDNTFKKAPSARMLTGQQIMQILAPVVKNNAQDYLWKQIFINTFGKAEADRIIGSVALSGRNNTQAGVVYG